MEEFRVVVPMLTNRRIERVVDAAWLRVGMQNTWAGQYCDPIAMSDYDEWDFETVSE